MDQIDLILDFLTIPGFLDDLIVLPLAVAVVLKMISPLSWTNAGVSEQEGKCAGTRVCTVDSVADKSSFWTAAVPKGAE
jgi:uncharacterized membrane protein YkvA (DUF1232 family)